MDVMMITIGHMAQHMKQLLPVEIPDTYAVDSMYLDLASEEIIRAGVSHFRTFMGDLCNELINDEILSSTPKKGKDKAYDETTLTVEFPFINNIRSILMNIGEYGLLSEDDRSIIMPSWDKLSLKRSHNKNSTTKISNAQMFKSLRVLNTCGIVFDGIDLNEKRPDVSAIEHIYVKYPKSFDFLIGWKALARADMEFSNRQNDNILLRCDYRMLSREEGDVSSFIGDFLHPLSEPLQGLIKDLHGYYMDSGMTCQVERGSFCTQLVYSYKKKAIWRFSSSLNNGYRMVLKTKNTHKYPEMVDSFTPVLRDTIRRGYGCDRKSGSSHGNCSHSCEGFRFKIDESILEIKDEIKMWQGCELKSMEKKR